MKKYIIYIMFILMISSVYAVCTVTLNKDIYSPGEVATATMECSEQIEKNQAYTVFWYNGSANVENDTGTTPSLVDTPFFETFTIPSGVVWNLSYTNLSGTNLEGQYYFNVTGASVNDLVLIDFNLTDKYRLGKHGAVKFKVTDNSGNAISNAECQVDVINGDDLPILNQGGVVNSRGDGTVLFSNYLYPNTFFEGREYKWDIVCVCYNHTNRDGFGTCFDSDNNVEITTLADGSSQYPFNINTWLTVNTVTDKLIYNMKDEIFVCANVTNVDYIYRIPMHIVHQIRCSKNSDNNNDTDRVLIATDSHDADKRGIASNTTQMQCKRFVLPEPKFLQGRNSECYASTEVWVINEEHRETVGYATTSAVFNITSSELNIFPDWQRIKIDEFYSVINLSDNSFSNYNGSGTGNIDVKINDHFHTISAEKQQEYESVDLSFLTLMRMIKNITVWNSTGSVMSHNLEFLDDGSVEIEIINAELSSTGWYNISMIMNNYDERQTNALEGINTSASDISDNMSLAAASLEDIANKTGTFRMEVNCSSQVIENEDLKCNIVAQIEFGDQQKETKFTCSIDGTGNREIILNRKINTTTSYIPITFSTIGLNRGTHTIECTGSYYNLGSRTDSFQTPFDVVKAPNPIDTTGASGKIEDLGFTEKVENTIERIKNNFIEGAKNNSMFVMVLMVLVTLAVTNKMDMASQKKKPVFILKEEEDDQEKT